MGLGLSSGGGRNKEVFGSHNLTRFKQRFIFMKNEQKRMTTELLMSKHPVE